MVVNFKVFKKCSPNGKITLYLGKRDFIDNIATVEAVDGIVVLDNEYVREERKIFGQLVCSFRYGREEDEVMGLNFQKELFLASEQIYPPPEKSAKETTKLQERLLKKLGPNAVPFSFQIPKAAPASVTLQQSTDEDGEPCGVQYYVKVNCLSVLHSYRKYCTFGNSIMVCNTKNILYRFFLARVKVIELIVAAHWHWAFVKCNLPQPNKARSHAPLFVKISC